MAAFQEGTCIVLARVFSSSTNCSLLFKAHACAGEMSRGRFPQIHWLRGKILLKGRLFYQLVALTLWLCCLCERSTIILVEIFSDMCCLRIVHPGTVRQTQWLDPFNQDRRRDRWLREEDMLKRWVNLNFSCLSASQEDLYIS